MRLWKEIYRDADTTAIKETFYNEEGQIIAIAEKIKSEENDGGTLQVYDYSEQHLRIARYQHGTSTYDAFLLKGRQLLGTGNWHKLDEAWHIREEKYEKGMLIYEQSHSVRHNIKTSASYEYRDGLKVAEKSVSEEGTVLRSVFTYQYGVLESKTTFRDEQFAEQVIYLYGESKLLTEEQIVHKYKDAQYLAQQRKYFYYDDKKLLKTEYYGRYDGRMILYKVDENIWDGNVVTELGSFTSNADFITGYYDMEALYAMLRETHMEYEIAHFDKQYMDRLGMDIQTKTVKTYDHMNKEMAVAYWHVEFNEVLSKMVYRNEYNEQSQLEFVISYVDNEGRLEERDIRKYYYYA
ncbi:hypothetical protein [Chitinophaga pinensis]|uniref:Uncharacterized protein n=1 Tax=Chitinophaga pinensis (strain ATCC 43595 / DSM 2588 / LMG 13176 / NBRC 15968 / NCIMB 11800 / UQM 2034) TaxID=485918 RepID=A0A979GA62_CHIPD|nr:hypothetical protein [Chitinophaga pinensis]ACU63759.1 hypothetical protein Cpin_6355 [Chitinophaga pinensis DSM 2588]